MKEFIVTNLPLLRALAEKFRTYQNAHIDLKHIIHFLVQFEDPSIAKSILDLLSRIDFIDSDRMTYLLLHAYKLIDSALLTRPLICPLGSIQDSSALVCNKLIKTLFDEEAAGLEFTTELSMVGAELMRLKPTTLIFFDDNITSGTQLTMFFKELIDGSDNTEIVKTRLTEEQLDQLKATPIRLCFAIQLSDSSNEIVKDIMTRYGLDIKVHVGKTDFNNYLDYTSSVLATREETEKIQSLIMSISKGLYENKQWAKETLYSRLLGYGNLGKLTVFYHNVPKSLIPVFWKYGNFKNKPWVPLFPETQEAKAIAVNNVTLDPFWLELFDGWISSEGGNRKSSLTFGFLLEGKIVSDIEIFIPSEIAFINLYKSFINPTSLKANNNNISTRMLSSSSFSQMHNLKDELTDKEYKNYLSAVERYNSLLDEYKLSVERYVFWYISERRIRLVLQNSGTISATNVKMEILYNSGNLIISDFEDLPKPEFKENKPLIEDFQSGVARIVSTPFKFPEILFGKKHDPIVLDTDYQLKEIWPRIGHNDDRTVQLEIHKINDNVNEFELPYQINFDEESETISGNLSIRFIPSDDWKPGKELDNSVHKLIDSFFSDLHRGPRTRSNYR